MKHIFITLFILTTALCSKAQIITTIAGNGTQSFSGDGGTATSAELNKPSGTAVDAAGNVYIVDYWNHRIRKINTSGVITTIAGTGTGGFSGDGGPAVSANLWYPYGITIDKSGNIYIADQWNNRIREINTSGIINTIAGSGAIGFGAGSYSGDGGAATSATLYRPLGIAVDTFGNVFVADHSNRVRKINTSGLINTIAGNGTPSFSGDGGPAVSASINDPYGLAIDLNGNIYIADVGNDRIREVSTAGIITTIAGTGVAGYSGDGGSATSAQINPYLSVTVDGCSNIYIADYNSYSIRIINTSGIIETFAGNGSVGYSGDGGPATSATLSGPGGISHDATGNIYFTDLQRVRKVNLTPTTVSIPGINLCAGSNTTLTDATPGGTWLSSNPSVATIGSTSGSVFGVTDGTTTISYTVSSACGSMISTHIITVNPLPVVGPIAGASVAYIGSTITLSDLTSGGVWSSEYSSIATVGSSGIVMPISLGIDTIKYTVTNGCGSMTAVKEISIAAMLPCYVSSADLVSWYPFTGNDLDSSGNGNNLTNSGASLTYDRFGNANRAYYFNGSSMLQILLPSSFMPSSSNYYSTSFWFKKFDNSASVIWQCTDDTISNVSNYDVFSNHSGCDGKTMAVQDYPFYNPSACSPDTLAINQWYNIVIVFNQVADSFLVYKNGIFFFSGPLGNISPAHGLLTFGNNGNGTFGFVGAIDDIGIWSRALTPCEITQLYNASCSPDAGTITGLSSITTGASIILSDAISGGIWSASNTNATISSSGVLTGNSTGIDTISYTVTNACGSATTTYIDTIGYSGGSSSSCYFISTIAGNGVAGYSGDGGLATAAEINLPWGVAVNSLGEVYIGDGPIVRKISNSGIITTVAGNGVVGFSGDGGPATSAKLNCNGIAVDAVGNLFISDYGNNRIRKVDTFGIITTVAGNGIGGFSGDGGPATSAEISGPTSVFVDNNGNLFIADYSNSRIRKVSNAGIISTVAGNGTAGYGGDGGPATAALLNQPIQVSVSSIGEIYISDALNNRIRKIDTFGFISTVVGNGTSAFSGDAGIASGATLNYPAAVILDADGNLIINDRNNQRIRKVNSSGIINTIAGNGIIGFSGDGGNALSAEFNYAEEIAIDGIGNIFISDNTNNRIRKLSSYLYELAPIAGSSTICSGLSTILNDSITGGVWSVSNGDATILTTGVVTGVSLGIDTISYSVLNTCGTTTVNKIVTINPLPNAGTILGISAICTGATTTLTDIAPGGIWSVTSANATVSGGLVTGISAGVDTVKYSVTNVCGTATASLLVTINPLPNPGTISGPSIVCTGSTITLADASSGGLWSTTNGNAIVSGGLVTGVSSGIDTIEYIVINSCGAATVSKTVTINPSPIAGSISGLISVCQSSSINLSDGVIGGTWSSSITTIATVGSAGNVTGISAGTAVISYAVTNTCGTAYSTQLITVNPLPTAGTITGSATVCVGSTILLTDLTIGGAWSATNGNSAITSGGVVYGIIAGIDTVVYSVTNICGTAVATKIVTVNPLPNAGTISGLTNVCVSSTITLSDIVSGGTWNSSNTAIGTISGSGIVIGVNAGTTTIIYSFTNSCGTATTTKIVTVNPLPNAGTISGASNLCVGSSTALTDGIIGGTWAAINGNAIITSGGSIYGMTIGIDTIIYSFTNSCGTATTTKIVTINPLPNAGSITGSASLCAGSFTTLSDVVPSGVWTSSPVLFATVGSTGIVTGVAAGTSTISYTVTNSCGSAIAIHSVVVNPLPNAGSILGVTSVCAGSNTTLSDATAGGIWTASNTNADITSTGVVLGMTAGIDTISYTITNSCGAATATKIVTVNALPSSGTITGTSTVCVGANITLSDATTGGIWSSSATLYGTVGSTGTVSGISSGTTTISYAVTNTCGTSYSTKNITVNPLPSAGTITGSSSVCAGSTIILSDTAVGGVWSASNSNATVSSTGGVYGLTYGVDTIYYHTSNSCGSAMSSKTVTINPLPNAGSISGSSAVCVSSGIMLTDMSAGGIWSITNANASIGSTGVVTGLVTGFDTVRYIVVNSCGSDTAVQVITITTIPNAGTITGVATVCTGSSIALTDAVVGGLWTSSNSNGIVSSLGVVIGMAGGLDTIKYIVTNACGSSFASKIVTVNASPNAGSISGASSVCVDAHVTLTDLSPGGTWSSSNGDATVASGTVSGVSSGIDTIKYTVSNSCGTAVAEYGIVVEPLPHAGTITGLDTLCAGMSIMLSDTAAGGIWSSITGAATVSSTGLVTGLHSGVDTVRYTVTNSCGSAIAKKPIFVRQAGDCTTAVDLSSGATDISVIPNPNKGLFTVKGTFAGMSDNVVTIEVSSMLGQTVYKRQLITKEGMINEGIQLGNSIANGMYLLTIISGNEVKMFHVVVEQ